MPHDEPVSNLSTETYNPWTIVNVVFDHLVEHGFHPTLGAGGHPGEPAAALLRALGVSPTVEGDAKPETVVAVLTGHGLKDPDTAIGKAPAGISCENDLSEVERAVFND